MVRKVYSKRQIRRVSSRTSFSRLASETTNKSSFQGRNAHATEVYPRWIDIVLVQTGHARNYNSGSTVMLVLAQKKSAGSSVRSTFNIDRRWETSTSGQLVYHDVLHANQEAPSKTSVPPQDRPLCRSTRSRDVGARIPVKRKSLGSAR